MNWPLDWRDVVDEARRRRHQEGLSQRRLAELAGVSPPTVVAFESGDINLRFERVVAILVALGMFSNSGRTDPFLSFIYDARRRWAELTAPLPADHASRQPLGHCEQAYQIVGRIDPVRPRELLRRLEEIPRTSGWSPFWIATRDGLRPEIEDNLIECWLGRPDVDRHFNDPAHSDFWRIDSEGRAYLQRGYQEDGSSNLEPGAIFDLTLPIWRTAEILFHAINLAKKLGAEPSAAIRLVGRYTGLEGRTLFSWAQPLLATTLDTKQRARSSRVDLEVTASIPVIEHNMVSVIDDFLRPLYERFNGYEPPIELIGSQVAELRRQPGFGAERD